VFELIKAQPESDANAKATEEMQAEAKKEMVKWAAQKIQVEFAPSTWEAFMRTSIQGGSVASVAKETGRSAGSIYVARHRVISRLKEEVSSISQHWEL
jgi:RNA polymerase sigma-70 factor (ECF subfamily)